MKSYVSKCLPVGIFWGIILVLVLTPIAQAANNQYKSLQTDIVIRSMTEKEKIQDDKDFQKSIKPPKSSTDKFFDWAGSLLGIATGSGESITDTMADGFKNISKTKIAKSVQQVSGVNSRAAQKFVKGLKGNLKLGGKLLAAGDNAGTGGTIAGALAGKDLAGATEGLINGVASGGTATAASAGAVFLASAASASIYGAPLGPLGMAVSATVGGIAGSIVYSQVAEPQVRKAGDWATNEISDIQQKAAATKNRTSADYHIVYPNGVLGATPEELDPKTLRAQAQAITDERNNFPYVPSTYGLDGDTAKQKLISSGFSPSVTVGKLAEDAGSENKVYAQSLKVGHRAKPGTSVLVTVYGKIAITTVPNAIGLQAQIAGNAIRGADLIYQPVVGDPAGEVSDQFMTYSQDPVAGTEVNRKTPVKVLVYSKFAEKEITVPSVKGLGASEAQIRITELGLSPIFVKGEPAPDPAQTNTVKSQTPGAGTIFKNKGTVIVTLYDMDKKNAHCQKNEGLFASALEGNLITRCHDILSEAVECPFYASAVSKLKRRECLEAKSSYDDAINAKRFSQAKGILGKYGQCEFALGGAMAALKCAENQSIIDSMLQRNDMGGIKTVLSLSTNCSSFYPSYMAALAQAEKNAAKNKKNKELFWQMLGGVMTGLSNSSTISSSNSSAGNAVNTGPPVVHEGTCNDVRKAGGDRPEQHNIDIGRSGKTFRFDYQTHSQEDMVIVSQGGQVLFNSGCVGTGTTKSIILKKKSYRPQVTVDIRPNCKGGSGTAWEFKVHCPE